MQKLNMALDNLLIVFVQKTVHVHYIYCVVKQQS